MNSRRAFLALVGLLALAVAGCSSREQKLVGTWQPQGRFAAAGNIVLNADKTFTMGNAKGSWKLSENTVTLNVTEIDGKPKDEALKQAEDQMKQMGVTGSQMEQLMSQTRALMDETSLTASEDMKTLTMTAFGQNISFTKAEG